jgi:hypothetical protein
MYLTIEELIKSKAHRTMRRMSNYHNISEKTDDIHYLGDFSFRDNEEPVGIYENLVGEPDESIIITTLGLYIFRAGDWEFVGYDEIRAITKPKVEKLAVDRLFLHLASGRRVDVPIKGGEGRFRDVYEFLRFLMRVTESIQSRAQNSKI